MIEQIPDLPDNVLGFTARGTVTANDYKTIIVPAVEAMFSHTGKARMIYHLGPELKGFEAGAMWDDAKVGLKHWSGWEKIALVSDIDWVRWSIKMFALLMPAQVRVFHNEQFDLARKWVCD